MPSRATLAVKTIFTKFSPLCLYLTDADAARWPTLGASGAQRGRPARRASLQATVPRPDPSAPGAGAAEGVGGVGALWPVPRTHPRYLSGGPVGRGSSAGLGPRVGTRGVPGVGSTGRRGLTLPLTDYARSRKEVIWGDLAGSTSVTDTRYSRTSLVGGPRSSPTGPSRHSG